MMVTIPRAEVAPILERHNDHWGGTADFEPWMLRGVADMLRRSTEPDYKVEADELDALADRYERQVGA